jgi:hypothetical protein
MFDGLASGEVVMQASAINQQKTNEPGQGTMNKNTIIIGLSCVIALLLWFFVYPTMPSRQSSAIEELAINGRAQEIFSSYSRQSMMELGVPMAQAIDDINQGREVEGEPFSKAFLLKAGSEVAIRDARSQAAKDLEALSADELKALVVNRGWLRLVK